MPYRMTLNKERNVLTERTTRTGSSQISMGNELKRKMIHLCSISIPILYISLSSSEMLWILLPMTVSSFVVEELRFRNRRFDRFFVRLFGSLLRPHEVDGKPKYSGATYVLLSASLCVLIFPKVITVVAFAVLIISDTASALIGRPFGKHRFFEKSVEGSAAFFVTAVGVVFGVAGIYDAPWEFIIVGMVAALAATVVEALSHGVNIDDNLTIPLSFGGVMWGVFAVLQHPAIELLLAIQ